MGTYKSLNRIFTWRRRGIAALRRESCNKNKSNVFACDEGIPKVIATIIPRHW